MFNIDRMRKEAHEFQTCSKCGKFPAFKMVKQNKTKSTRTRHVLKKRVLLMNGRKDWSPSDLEPDEYEDVITDTVKVQELFRCTNCGYEKESVFDRELSDYSEDDDIRYYPSSSKTFD